MASNAAPVVDRIRIIPRPEDFLDRNVGSSGEVFYDREANTLRVYDGRVSGGFEVVTKSNLHTAIKESNIATVRYTVVIENQGEGNKYILNGAYKPVLNFVVGYTYVFDQSDDINVYYPNAIGTINNQHPLNFSADNLNGVLGGGTSYLTGVTYQLDNKIVDQQGYWNGFENATQRSVSIKVTSDTPTTLYYWCQLHLNMGNSISVANPGSGAGSEESGASVDVSDTAPENPEAGNIWFNSSNGRIYVYVTDADSSQWIQPVAPVPSVNTFNEVQITGQTTVTADSASESLTFVAGNNITLVTDNLSKSITINSAGIATGSDVTLGDVTADSFITQTAGPATFDSASTLNLNSTDGTIIGGGGTFRLPSFTDIQRDAFSAQAGDLIYNTDNNRIEAYVNGAWVIVDTSSIV